METKITFTYFWFRFFLTFFMSAFIPLFPAIGADDQPKFLYSIMNQNEAEVLRFLENRPLKIDINDKEGPNPLCLAALSGNPKIVSHLLNHGASLDAYITYDKQLYSAFALAAKQYRPNSIVPTVMRELLKRFSQEDYDREIEMAQSFYQKILADQLELLKLRASQKISDADQGVICTICKEAAGTVGQIPLLDGSYKLGAISSSGCSGGCKGIFYCKFCLEGWVARKSPPTCPTCRNIISTTIHAIEPRSSIQEFIGWSEYLPPPKPAHTTLSKPVHTTLEPTRTRDEEACCGDSGCHLQ